KLLPHSSDEEIDRVLEVNVKGPLYAARHAIPIMSRQPEGGVILFTASKTGLVAQRDSPAYCASKGAVVLLAKALALDYATCGIRFPTARERDGSDAMSPDPDYSAAYAVLRTDRSDGLEGHGLTFTPGRGNELCVAAIRSLAPFVQGLTLEGIKADMARFWRR